MRLLHVVPSFYPAHRYGGPIVSLHRLAVAQVAQGLEVRVLTCDADGRDGPEAAAGLSGRWVTEYGVPTWYAPATRLRVGGLGRWVPEDLSMKAAACLPGLLQWAERVHVTAVFSPLSAMALVLSAAMGRKVVLSPRGSLLPWALLGRRHKALALSALRPVLRRVAGWHATSQEEARAIRELSLCGERAVVAVVENGVDLGEFPPAPSRPPGDRGAVLSAHVAATEGPVVVLLGRLHPVKGLCLAIAALQRLRRRHPRAVLVLAGPDADGYGDLLRREAEQKGVADAVRFTGLVTGADKAGLLHGSDQLWLCSRMESFGNVVIEALAAGTPVVAVQTTPWSFLPEAGLGRWVPATAEAVAAAADELLLEFADSTDEAGHGETPRRHAFAARARAAVTARYSWDQIARRMGRFYDQAFGALSTP
jgi:glycosyltransferase involved in cell wall biosynthesis